jgi:hypothetical protein
VKSLSKAIAIGCALFAAPVGPAKSPSTPQSAAEELLAADRSFSDAGAKLGLVQSLGAMFDDEVVMPTPAATLAIGKAAAVQALGANAASQAARAEWAPVRAGISADGQHGFTFGYMTVRESGKPDRQVKYLAYWLKRPEGWRVAAYKRAPKPEGQGTGPMEPLLPARLIAPVRDFSAMLKLKSSLVAAEKQFSDEAQKVGLGAAFRKHGRADAMNMGRGPEFRIGAEAIGADMGTDSVSPLHWSADGAKVASSEDLGVTWGTIRPNGPPPEGRPAAIPFFTIWYRASASEPWRYVAE